MNTKNRIDFRSIKFKVWIYITVLMFIVLFLIWLLQIFFLNNYYDKMKISENRKTVTQIHEAYQNSESEDIFFDSITSIIEHDDIYVKVITKGKVKYASDSNLEIYRSEIEQSMEALNSSDNNRKSVSLVLQDETSGRETWVYSAYLDASHDTLMHVLAPLYPVNSTISILKHQLMYITGIVLLLSFTLVVFISRRIAKPITNITASANKLCEGDYGITFSNNYAFSEINDLANTLNKASYELERISMLQRDLIANVSHDLKTPLTMVKSYAEMIRDLSGDIPDKRNAHLQVIIDESDRLNKLVNDILTLSDVQAGTLKLHIERFSIKELISSVLQPFEVLQQNEGYQIVFNCRQDAEVIGDPSRIKQVVYNLMSNGIKYCGEDKKIFVNIKKWGKRVHCEFVDHGQGIKPDELPYIWERYFKTSTHHVRATKGSGIGLSIVKGILTAHNARFGVESKVGRGTTFWFELEVAPEPVKKIKENRNRLLR